MSLLNKTYIPKPLLFISLPVCLFFCLLLPGCNYNAPATFETPSTAVKWLTLLPGKAGIYNDGLIGLPVYDSKIIFHSTYFSSSTLEDNRLHALDMETGELIWTYPAEYNGEDPHFFWGVPYLYNEYLITKMPTFGSLSDSDYLLCIDIKTGTGKWKFKLPANQSRFTCRNLTGVGETVYFVQQSASNGYIYRANVFTGSRELLYIVEPMIEGYDKVEITSHDIALLQLPNDTLLVMGIKESNTRDSDNKGQRSLFVVNLSKACLMSNIPISGDSLYSISSLKTADSFVYLSCGRTAFCVDIVSGEIVWSFYANSTINEAAPSLEVSRDVIMLWGHKRCLLLCRQTGVLLNEFNLEAGNVTVDDNHAYIVGRDGQFYVLSLSEGSVHVMQPFQLSNSNRLSFSTGCKPRILDGKIYAFGYQHAICFETEKSSNAQK